MPVSSLSHAELAFQAEDVTPHVFWLVQWLGSHLGLTGETRWDALIAAVVDDESATRDVPPTPTGRTRRVGSSGRSGICLTTNRCTPGNWPEDPNVCARYGGAHG